MEVMRNCVIFNGTDLRDYGLYVSGDKTFDSPRKEYTKVSIPGRSGDLIRFDGRYSNVTLKYDAILIKNYEKNAAALRSILLSPEAYCRIEDSYHPDEYRLGYFEGPLEFDSVFLQAGETTLEFSCRPERFLKDGETPIDITNGGTIRNSTMFSSKPIITITGYGNLSFTFSGLGGTTSFAYKIPQASSGTYTIDCEEMDCSSSVSGIYPNSFYEGSEFPMLTPGNNTITITKSNASVSSITITPRWYIL